MPTKRRSPAAGWRAILADRRASIPGFNRHSRKCEVCHDADVLEIEHAFVNWYSARYIVETFDLEYLDTVYHHARALGLDVARRQNVRVAVEKLVEEVDRVTVTSATVLRAIRALSCIDANGRWTDPPSTHIVLTGKDMPQQNLTSAPPAAADPIVTTQPPTESAEDISGTGERLVFTDSLATSHSPLATDVISNRLRLEGLEIAVTDTNQREEVISNR